MASFQIVYDDFSGGQYMGPRSTNWPKNTFSGEDAIANTYGEVMAGGGMYTAYIQSPVTNSTQAKVMDQWIIGENIYSFCQWYASSTWTAKMLSFNVANGTVFPSPTVTTTSLTGQIGGKVAYDNSNSKFFYVRSDGGSAGYIRSVTTSGTDASVSTALGATGITNIALYGYRLVAWGDTSKRLYYSNTDLATFSTSQYYEFTGEVLNVLPRSNDLLVVCTTGVFSLVGVLGSSVTIQLILPGANMPEGMRDAIIVGRNAIFPDNSRSGNLDGRLHEMIGSTIRPIANIDFNSIQYVGAIGGYEQMRCFNAPDSGIAIVLKSGSVYVRRQDGVWKFMSNSYVGVTRSNTDQIHIARPGVNAQNEYIIATFVDADENYQIRFDRGIYGVTDTTYLDHDFRTTTTASGEAMAPSGTARLAEYWHSKPFSVKNAIIEWTGRTNSYITVQIIPTGVVDTPGADVFDGRSEYLDTTLDASYVFNTERIFVNNAQKGYGVKISVSMYDSRVKRVILNCED